MKFDLLTGRQLWKLNLPDSQQREILTFCLFSLYFFGDG